jgi:hypothetical protein
MIEPVPALIESGPDKIEGFVLKMNATGLMIECDRIPYRVGATVLVRFSLPGFAEPFVEEMRAIKSYDRFFRNPPKPGIKIKDPSGQEPQPKKLSELHFVRLKETTRHAMTKYLLAQQVSLMKKSR